MSGVIESRLEMTEMSTYGLVVKGVFYHQNPEKRDRFELCVGIDKFCVQMYRRVVSKCCQGSRDTGPLYAGEGEIFAGIPSRGPPSGNSSKRDQSASILWSAKQGFLIYCDRCPVHAIQILSLTCPYCVSSVVQ